MSFTGATAGYQAGAQANDVVLSYALEESYGVPPGGNWQRLRLSGETFRVQKTRQRPEEIEASGEASRAVTTQVSVSGTLSGALSFQTYDDLLCGVMGADFTPISRVAAVGLPVLAQQDDYHGVKFKDLYDTGTLIPSLGPGGFFSITNSTVGSVDTWYAYRAMDRYHIEVRSFSDQSNVQSTLILPNDTLVSTTILVNGQQVKTFSLQEEIAGSWLLRTGGFVSRVQLSFAQGGFPTLSADIQFRSEGKADSSSAAALLPATSDLVLDTVQGWGALWIDLAQVPAVIRQLSITLDRDGAGQDYAMGAAAAAGQRSGSFMASGQIQLYFRDGSQYEQFASGWQGQIHALVHDADGNAYGFTWLSATLQNPQINAGSKNTSIIATFDIEGNPLASGGTFCVSRMPAGGNP